MDGGLKVIKRVLLASLVALAFCAQAAPITFFNTQYNVAAATSSGSVADAESHSSPPDGLPLVASAASVEANLDIATAGAIAGAGLLSTSADVSSLDGFGSASSQSQFVGSFLNGNGVFLNLDFFQPADFSEGSGVASTFLYVLLKSDGATLFDDFITGDWNFKYNPAAGTTSVLELTLFSEASAGFLSAGAGGGSTFGQVTFDGTVPLPATHLLVLVGLAAMGVVRRLTPRALSAA
jgi:hypothetical protein